MMLFRRHISDDHLPVTPRRLIRVVLLFCLLNLTQPIHQVLASSNEIWFAPPNDMDHAAGDYGQIFNDPKSWSGAMHGISVLSMTANYLTLTPAPVIAQDMAFLKQHGLQLDVSIPALPVNKRICGNGVEGLIWPGEIEGYVKHLKARGIKISSFSFDTPLNSGFLYHGKNACHFSIKETALRIASSVKAIRAVYPTAKIIDQDVPTGIPVERWRAILTEWLADFKAASGEQFYGFTMDIYWHFPWHDSVATTIKILAANGVHAGIFLDAVGGPGVNATQWISEAKQSACNLQRANIVPDYTVLANWSSREVHNVPESGPNTLTSLLLWYETSRSCL